MKNIKFNSEFSKNRNIVYELVRKNVKSQYRNSVFGMLWSVLNPLLNMAVMYFIFYQLYGKNDKYFILYLLCGTILVNMLRGATNSAMNSIVQNKGLLTKIKIKESLFPLSSALSATVNTSFSFISLFIIMLIMQIFGGYNLIGYQVLFCLPFIPALFMFVYGIGLFLSALYVFFKDISHLYNVFLTLWVYLTPVFYKEDLFSNTALKFLKLNPMYWYLKYFRQAIYICHTSNSGMPSFKILLALYIIGIIVLVIGLTCFKSLKKKFVMYL
ncbi:MAG: ABC transporter permease [Clostridia bacterium]|nr:ABC transporter permease [Clostridia bacterium]